MRIIECVHDTVGVYFAGERALSVGRPCECLPRVGLGLLSGRRQGVNWDRWKQPMSRWVADVFPARPGRCSDSGLGWVQDAAFRAVPYRTRQSSHTSLELNKAHFSRGNRRPPDWVNGTCIQGPIARWIRKKGTAPVAQLKNSVKMAALCRKFNSRDKQDSTPDEDSLHLEDGWYANTRACRNTKCAAG
jgi:hypothetical protein